MSGRCTSGGYKIYCGPRLESCRFCVEWTGAAAAMRLVLCDEQRYTPSMQACSFNGFHPHISSGPAPRPRPLRRAPLPPPPPTATIACLMTHSLWLTGTDVASSFCVPAEAVVASLKNARAGSSSPVFVVVDTRSSAAFGRGRLPTALHMPVLAENTVSTASACTGPLTHVCFNVSLQLKS